MNTLSDQQLAIYEARRVSDLKAQVQTLRQQQASFSGQIEQLRRERDDASSKLAALEQENERLRGETAEIARLRGEAARLRNDAQELARLKGANNGGMPTDLTQLHAYFKSPVDDAILQRWEIAPAETIKSLGMGGGKFGWRQ